MSKTIDINIDPAKIIEKVFGKNGKRNDLAVAVQNDTDQTLSINYYIEHGNAKNIDTAQNIEPGQTWEGGVHAVGAGSNITLDIGFENGSAFALMAATPVNKQNYMKVTHSDDGYSSPKSAYKAADKKDKHYSDRGYLDSSCKNHQLTASITNNSPAVCNVVISDS